jgi:DNA-binding transcriptional LysR family regulator
LQQDLTDHTQVTLSYVDEFSVKSLLPIGLSSFELMRDAVLDGLGWAVLPSPLIQSQLRREAADPEAQVQSAVARLRSLSVGERPSRQGAGLAEEGNRSLSRTLRVAANRGGHPGWQ